MLEFNIQKPLKGLHDWNQPFYDSHLHVWEADSFKTFLREAKRFGDYQGTLIAQPAIKAIIEDQFSTEQFVFAYYLSVKAFGEYNITTLLSQVDEAHEQGYKVAKMWFAPRFQDYTNVNERFWFSSDQLSPVFDRIEDYGLVALIHVADPDITYKKNYSDSPDYYGSKNSKVAELEHLLDAHPKLEVISAHLGSLPEDLPKLGHLLDKFPNLMVDTASTRWMVRELGHNIGKTQEWLEKYKERILLGTDLSVGGKNTDVSYYLTRIWSQRIFWETNEVAPLPFSDSDNPSGTTIHGLGLPQDVLERLYYQNAHTLFFQ